MFSKTSFKSLKHKAKKGVLTKIGMHEEKQEDPVFQAVLFSVTNFKNELKDISFKAHGLGSAGTGYNNAIAFLCGDGLKGEWLFDKEQKFIDSIKESLCQVLSKIIETDIPEMDTLVIKYKGAKLDYDRLYYQTVKDMTKKEIEGTDNRGEVHKNNTNLPILREGWEKAKKAVIDQRNVYKGRLDNEVLKALQEVTDVSDAPHHRLYIDYFKERILITSAMCDSGTVSARKTAVPIKGSEVMEANDSEEVENEIEYKTSPVQVDQGENKVEPDEEKGAILGEQYGGAVDNRGEQLEEVSLPPARLPPRPPKEEVEPLQVPSQAPIEQPQVPAAPAQGEGPPQPPAVPNQEPAVPPQLPPPAVQHQEPVVPPQAPPVAAMGPEIAPQPPAVPDQEPAQPPQAPPMLEMQREMPPQPPAVPDQEPAVPRQAPPALAMDRGMPAQPPAVPNQEPVMPPQAPVQAMQPEMPSQPPALPPPAPVEVPQPPAVVPQPPVGPPQPPAAPQQPPIGPPQPPVGPPQPPQVP